MDFKNIRGGNTGHSLSYLDWKATPEHSVVKPRSKWLPLYSMWHVATRQDMHKKPVSRLDHRVSDLERFSGSETSYILWDLATRHEISTVATLSLAMNEKAICGEKVFQVLVSYSCVHDLAAVLEMVRFNQSSKAWDARLDSRKRVLAKRKTERVHV
jgi:hypothetical protein